MVPSTVTTVPVVVNVPLPLIINFAPVTIEVATPGDTAVVIVIISVFLIATFGEALVGIKVAGFQVAPASPDACQTAVFDQLPLVIDLNQLPGVDDTIIVCTPPVPVVVATELAAVEKVRLAKAIAGVACMVLFVTAPAATSAVTQKYPVTGVAHTVKEGGVPKLPKVSVPPPEGAIDFIDVASAKLLVVPYHN